MTDEQIKQQAKEHAKLDRGGVDYPKFLGYIAGAHSRDEEIKRLYNSLEHFRSIINNLRNPWISVNERLPEEDKKEDGSRKYYSQPVFVRYETIWDGQTKSSIYYGTAFVFYTGDTPAWSGHNAREGQCTERITHWMPIPNTIDKQ